jgi:DUF438 domain-containing protein
MPESAPTVPLRTRALTPVQIAPLVTHRPFDATFAGTGGLVPIHSKGKDRIFGRTPGASGRTAPGSRPPHRLPQMKRILDDFRAAAIDTVEFRRQTKGGDPPFIRIRGFGVADSDIRIRGTLEAVRDVTRSESPRAGAGCSTKAAEASDGSDFRRAG